MEEKIRKKDILMTTLNSLSAKREVRRLARIGKSSKIMKDEGVYIVIRKIN